MSFSPLDKCKGSRVDVIWVVGPFRSTRDFESLPIIPPLTVRSSETANVLDTWVGPLRLQQAARDSCCFRYHYWFDPKCKTAHPPRDAHGGSYLEIPEQSRQRFCSPFPSRASLPVFCMCRQETTPIGPNALHSPKLAKLQHCTKKCPSFSMCANPSVAVMK